MQEMSLNKNFIQVVTLINKVTLQSSIYMRTYSISVFIHFISLTLSMAVCLYFKDFEVLNVMSTPNA